MKKLNLTLKLFFVILISFFFQQKIFSQQSWIEQSSGTDNDLSSVFFNDIYNGWAVGRFGTILKTTDGGENWTIKPSGTTAWLHSVVFVDEKSGWIVGSEFNIPGVYKSIILRTTDGGTNWYPDSMKWLPNKIFFIDKDTGWAICSIAEIYPDYYRIIVKTTDGGISWSHQTDGPQTSYFDDLFFTDENKGWVVGHLNPSGNRIIMKTTDGGLHWETLPNDSSAPLYSLYFADSSNGCMVGDGGLVLKTTDEGTNWIEKSSGTAENLFNVYFIDDLTGWAVGSNSIIISTTDGGINWIKQSYGITNSLYSVNFVDKNNGWAVGTNGTILHTINGSSLLAFNYFPLETGNKWFFSYGFDQVINIEIIIEKDTLLADEYQYAKLNVYFHNYLGSSSFINGWAYLRVASNKLIQYPNKVFLDFNMQIGDTVLAYLNPDGRDTSNNTYNELYKATLNDIKQISVFDKYLNTYYFNSTPYDYYSFTDSIGFNTLWSTTWNNWFPEYLLGCVIDSKEYGLITSVENHKEQIAQFRLSQNFPNPFNPTTKIEYSISFSSLVTLKVYDVLGREVETLVNEEKPAGNYEVKFNGNGLYSGIYFYKLQAGNYTSVKKMILIK